MRRVAVLSLSIAILALMSLETARAESLMGHYLKQSATEAEAEAEAAATEEEAVPAEEGYAGADPILGRTMASVLITDLVNIFMAPGATSYLALIFDLFNFIFIPVTGGFIMTSVEYNYEKDPITFNNAKISKQLMYANEMKLVKSSLYRLIGKPDFFEDSAAYVAPNVPNFDNL